MKELAAGHLSAPSLRMVEELLAARGITVSYKTVRQWARKFGPEIATRLRRRAPRVLITDKLKSCAAANTRDKIRALSV